MTVSIDPFSGTLVYEVNDPVPVRTRQVLPHRNMLTDGHTFRQRYNGPVMAWIDEGKCVEKYFIMRNILLQPVAIPHWLHVSDASDGQIEWIMLQRIYFRRRQALLACHQVTHGSPVAVAAEAEDASRSSYSDSRVDRILEEFIADCSSDRITLFTLNDSVLSLSAIVPRMLSVYFSVLPLLDVHPEMRGYKTRFDYTAMGNFLRAIHVDHHALYEISHRVCDGMLHQGLYINLLHAMYTNRMLFPAHFRLGDELGAANTALRLCRMPDGSIAFTSHPPADMFPAKHVRDGETLLRYMRKKIARALDALEVTDQSVRSAYDPIVAVPFNADLCSVACTDGAVYELDDWPLFSLGLMFDEFIQRLSQVLCQRYLSCSHQIHQNLLPQSNLSYTTTMRNISNNRKKWPKLGQANK